MARVTVEDCITKVPNRFDLVVLAAQRSRQLASGAAATLERDNDKNPVIALREIAKENLNLQELQENVVRSYQTTIIEENEDDIEDGFSQDSTWATQVAGMSKQLAEGLAEEEALEDSLTIQDSDDSDSADISEEDEE